MALPALSDWRVEALRVTFFYGEQQDAREKNWWQGVTGGLSPETTQNRPQLGEYLEIGNYLDGQFEMRVLFNRVDWVLSYPLSGLPDAPVSVEVEKTAKTLLAAIGTWLETSGTAPLRVAYGSILLFPIESQSEGNRLVSDFLPFFHIDVDSVEDVSLQLNFPRPSSVVDGLSINDLIKLGVLTGQFMELSGGVMPKVVTKHMLRTEFDLSTASDRELSLDAGSIMPLLYDFLAVSLITLKEGVRR